MPITVTEDETESGGFALVDLGTLVSSPEPNVSFRRQDAEPRNLGPDGWQSEVAWLAPLSSETSAGRTVLRFGPAVVDRIEELVPVEIVGQDSRSFGIVSWPYVTPAPATGGVLIETRATPAPPVEPAAPADEPREDLPLLVSSRLVEAVEAEILPAPSPAPELPPARITEVRRVTTMSAPAAKPARRRRTWPVAAALVLILLTAAGGAAYFYRDRLPWPPMPPREARILADELRREYGGLLQRRAGPGDLLAFGNRALAAGQGAIAFRAYDEADPVANEEAAWQLAQFYDPRVTDRSHRDAALPNAGSAAYYFALWKGRSARLTDELRSLCAVSGDAIGRDERLRTLCQA